MGSYLLKYGVLIGTQQVSTYLPVSTAPGIGCSVHYMNCDVAALYKLRI